MNTKKIKLTDEEVDIAIRNFNREQKNIKGVISLVLGGVVDKVDYGYLGNRNYYFNLDKIKGNILIDGEFYHVSGKNVMGKEFNSIYLVEGKSIKKVDTCNSVNSLEKISYCKK